MTTNSAAAAANAIVAGAGTLTVGQSTFVVGGNLDSLTPADPAAQASFAAMMQTGALTVFDDALASLYLQVTGDPNAAAFAQRVALSGSGFASIDGRAYVVVDIIARNGDGAALLAQIRAAGVDILFGSAFRGMTGGLVAVDQLPILQTVLGGADGVSDDIGMAHLARANSDVGLVTTQADVAQYNDIARATFAVDGTGIRVGVLSDSFNKTGSSTDNQTTNIASGDLPANTFVFQDYNAVGTDEGRAMAQLIHDLAPGATIDFATAFLGQASFANNILSLASRGADIIVDDVFYSNELAFQNGVIAQAVNQVAAQGVTYFASAGNGGTNGWDGNWVSGAVQTLSGSSYTKMQFANGQDYIPVTITNPSNHTYVVQWDSPSASAGGVGAPSNPIEIDIFLTDSSGNVLIGSQTVNIGGDAVQFMGLTGGSGTYRLVVGVKAGSAMPTELRVIARGATLGAADGNQNSSTFYTHAAAEGAIAVAAAGYSQTPAFGVPAPVHESFSTRGPDRHWYDDAGNRLSEVSIREIPITAVDGGNTTFFSSDDGDADTFPNFYGTSAAAPDAAAVAALMLQARGDLTPTDIRNLLQASALDMNDTFTAGFDAGYDSRTGAGLINANLAVGFAQNLVIANASQTLLKGTHLGDTINGSSAADTLRGFDGADSLSGAGGADTLEGGNGADTLTGGAAADSLTGGAGTDTFTGAASDLNGDTIVDLTLGETIVLSQNLAGPGAISFTSGSNKLGIDADNNGSFETQITLANAPTGGFTLSSAGGFTNNVLTFGAASVDINDAPEGADRDVAIIEDTPYTLTVANFGFTDPNDTPPDAFASVVITTLPATGVLKLNGAVVSAGQEISVADITAGLLVYSPASNVNGNDAASFTFQVRDDGGTADGGVDLDSTPNTLTFDISAVNDAPVVKLGGPIGTATTTLYTNSTPTALIDNGVVTSTITVSGARPYLLDFNLRTFLKHSFSGDLDITITSPSGTVVTITTDNGGSNDDVFDGTLWDDSANPGGQTPYATNDGLVTDRAYVNGVAATTLTPEEPFGAFIGEDPNGVWTITISDDAVGDSGSLDSWSIELATLPTAPVVETSSFTTQTPLQIQTGPAVATSTIFVSGAGPKLLDVNLTTLLTHSFAADLDITLTSPSGTVVTITTDNGAGNDDVFNGTVWDDDANPGGQVPYATNNGMVTDHAYVNLTAASTLTPEEALAAFIGEDPNGTWTITISDDLAGDGGSLASWSLDFKTVRGNSGVFTELTGPDTGANAVAFTGPGTNLSDVDSATLANLKVAIAASTVAAGDQLRIGATVIDITGAAASGEVTAGGTVFRYAIADASGVRTLTFQSLTGAGGAATPAAIAAYEALLDGLRYNNTSDNPVDGSTRSFAVTVNDGALDSAPDVFLVTLSATNDAPAGANGSANVEVNTPYVLTAANFGFTDVDGDVLQSVFIDSFAGSGALTLNGAPVTPGQEIAVASINAGQLRYTPPAGASGANLASFTFRVRDDGGTANGGIDTDPSANTLTFNVDTTPPLLVSTSPADEQGNIAPQANLVLTFNEAVKAGSGALQLYEVVNKTTSVLVTTILVTDVNQVSFSGSTMTVDPTANLQPGREYYLTFGSGVVVDLAGNAFAGLSSTQMNFFTAAPDTAAPVLVSSSPADDATGVNPAANLVLTFNEQVQAGTGSFEIWKLDPKFGAVLFRTIAAGDATQVSVSGASVTLNPTVDLDPSSSYYVNFTAGAVRDLAGNNAAALTSQSAYNFSTGLAAPLPTLAIGPANITLAEGNGGTTAYSFTVTRTGDTSGATTANWAVTGSSANPANAADFGGTLPSGVVSFVAGQTTATLTVNVAGDTAFEPTEGFTVTLSGASGSAVIATASATGTITNDDAGPPSLAIGPANLAQNEGNAGTTAFTFTVTRSGDVSGTSSANWAVSGSSGNAANVFDFATAEVFPSGTVTFAAGATTATIVVNVLGDTAFEPTEGFTVTLSSPSAGTTISTASATGTIVNDDTNPSDTTAPLLVSSSPADEQGNIAPQANLVLTFNEAVQAGSGVLQIYDNTDRFAAPVLVRTISVTDAGQVSFSGSTLTINPTADLSPSRAYYLTFGSGVVVDLAGNAFAGLSSTQMNFFTAAPDTAAPVLVSSSPADDATGVNPAANLVLTFNEQVQAGTGSFEIWKLDPKFGAVLFRTIAAGDATQVSVSGASVTLNPTVDLDPSSSYYVNFTAGAVRDLAGNNAAALTSQSAYNFSTGSGVVVVFHESFAAPAFSDDAYSAPLIGTPDDTPPTMDWTGILWG